MKKIFSILFGLLSLSAWGETSPQRAFELSQKNDAVIIDVREADEIKEGMVQGALWFPKSKIESDKNWKKDFQKLSQNKKVFLYCRSGKRSGAVQETLKKEGLKAENIGGMLTLKDILPIKKP